MTDQEDLIGVYREALEDCRQLFRRCAEETLRLEPERVSGTPGEFVSRMDDLHRGLVIKVLVEVAQQADFRWSPAEEILAMDTLFHAWGRRPDQRELRETLNRLVEHASQVRWQSLVRPFREYRSFIEHRVQLAGIVLRLAQVIAKVDGEVSPAENQRVRNIQIELEQELGSLPLADTPPAPPGTRQNQHAPQGIAEIALAPDLKSAWQIESAAAPVPQKSQPELLQEAMDELDALVGLANIRGEMKELANFLKIQREREKLGLPVTQLTLHSVYEGNPGTGKTTVARIASKILQALGVLTKGHLIETDRSGLVAEYQGQTGPKTNKRVDEAIDGVLFVDEAYTLVAEHGEDAYGQEAVQALLKRMEDERHRLVVVLAGYPAPLERMLKSNPGLSSRFSRRMQFEDYTLLELCQIFERKCNENHYALTPAARHALILGLSYLIAVKDEHFGNGRLVRNIFEGAIRRLANRVANSTQLTRELLTVLHAEDITMEGVPPELLAQANALERHVRIVCPGCGELRRMQAAHLGKKLQCKGCQTGFTASWGELEREKKHEGE